MRIFQQSKAQDQEGRAVWPGRLEEIIRCSGRQQAIALGSGHLYIWETKKAPGFPEALPS